MIDLFFLKTFAAKILQEMKIGGALLSTISREYESDFVKLGQEVQITTLGAGTVKDRALDGTRTYDALGLGSTALRIDQLPYIGYKVTESDRNAGKPEVIMAQAASFAQDLLSDIITRMGYYLNTTENIVHVTGNSNTTITPTDIMNANILLKDGSRDLRRSGSRFGQLTSVDALALKDMSQFKTASAYGDIATIQYGEIPIFDGSYLLEEIGAISKSGTAITDNAGALNADFAKGAGLGTDGTGNTYNSESLVVKSLGNAETITAGTMMTIANAASGVTGQYFVKEDFTTTAGGVGTVKIWNGLLRACQQDDVVTFYPQYRCNPIYGKMGLHFHAGMQEAVRPGGGVLSVNQSNGFFGLLVQYAATQAESLEQYDINAAIGYKTLLDTQRASVILKANA